MIGIFCVVKDDWEIIDDFIYYHSLIVGTSNIYIIDNESSDPRVHAVYEKYKPLGLTVHTEIGPHRHAYYLNKCIHMYKHLYEFIVPLDSDEFLYSTIAREHGGNPGDPGIIIKTFQSLPRDTTMFHVIEALTTMTAPSSTVYPAREINKFQYSSVFLTDIFLPKRIFRSDAFISITEGNHNGSVKYGDTGLIQIGHVHYHNTGNLRKFQRDTKFMKGRGYCDIDSSHGVQYDALYSNPEKEFMCDCHRVRTYSKKLVEIELFDLFLKYKKKIPTKDELIEEVEKINWTGTWSVIFNDFTASINSGEVPSVSEDMKNSLLFCEYTKNVPKYDAAYEVITSFISDILSRRVVTVPPFM
jgi:Glycosyl transferase family 2